MLSKQGRIPVVVLGRSLGSACAVEVGNVGVEGVRGLVLESGFGDIEAFVSRRGFRNPLSEEDLEAFCPLGKLKRTSLPLLVMHGQEDRLIDPREARMLFDASAATDKKLEYIPGHGHNDVLHASAYWRVLKSFLHEVAR
jgi:alpha-beta hydrolase superfamily lysophospholipase